MINKIRMNRSIFGGLLLLVALMFVACQPASGTGDQQSTPVLPTPTSAPAPALPAATIAAPAAVPTLAATAMTGVSPTASAEAFEYDYSDGGIYGSPTQSSGRPFDDSAELKVASSASLGSYLVDDNGWTVYRFAQDTPGVSTCEGQCLQNWPPVLTEKTPKADDGVDASKLGTLTREDGSIQVTYNEMPLYYYSGDLNPGDTNGQNVGGVWFVIAP